MPILTVSQLNRYVASVLHGDSNLRTVFIRGEIANFTENYRSGHCYFSIRDEGASVRAVMFRSNAERLPFRPENGIHILVQGSVSLYERDGSYQIQVTDMQPDGVGAQALALQQRREKLAKLGYFSAERKRSLPPMPQKIGIVTSRSGAALQDMLQILRRRYPIGTVQLYPAAVQGDEAPQSIADALVLAGNDGCDVILMGRGGGSNEDLSAFQSETVAQAVFSSPVPVISAVGHETDHCIADEVADLRAPTPSAAAELAVPDISVLRNALHLKMQAMRQAVSGMIERYGQQLDARKKGLQYRSPAGLMRTRQEELSGIRQKMTELILRNVEEKERALMLKAGMLEAVSPVAVLQRGYALVYHHETLAWDAATLSVGDELKIRLANGTLTAQITETAGV